MVPRSFIAFCIWLSVTLTAGQSELSRVAFDGAEPVDRELASCLFGETVPVGRRRVVAAVCGRRAGKSYVLVALRLVWGMLVREVPPLPPGIRAVAMIIAPRDSMRMEVFRYALGAVLSKPELAAMLVDKPRVDSFTLRRPDGVGVTFETGVCTAGGTAARGRWFTDFALDECAFFRNDSFKVNDEEIFAAGSSALLPGGQILIASTPWAETGLLYRFWKERPDNACVAHAPTLVLNDSEVTRQVVAEAEQLNPDSAKREFGAEFMTTGTTVFFDSASIDAALVDEPFEPQPGDVIAAGGDFAFLGDSSALIMVAHRAGMLHVYDGTEERPPPDGPLLPSKTVAEFAERIKGRCGYLMADGHHRASIEEHLQEHGLAYAAAPTTPSETHVRARMLMRERKVQIHPLPFRDRLVQQLREVQGRPTSGGHIAIHYPRWATGGHGDLVAAYVLALWQVSGDQVQEAPPVLGTQEWVAMHREARQKRHMDRLTQPRDRGRAAYWRKGA